MVGRRSVFSEIPRRTAASLVVRRAPSKRAAINEFQAHHLCGLSLFLVQRTLAHFEVESVADLPEEGWEPFTYLPEYGLFTSGVYACGFVCADLSPDIDIDAVKCRPVEALGGMTLPQLRHYVHTLMRLERAGFGYGSALYEAVRAGVLEVLCERLDSDSDLYESL